MPELEFAWWPLLLLLAAIPLLAWWQVRASRRRPRPAVVSAGVAPFRELATRRPRRRWIPLGLRLAAIALFIVALARPRAGVVDASVEAEGIDIMLALDVSRSMLDRLAPPNDASDKLTIAKDVLDEFIASRKNDRIGLVQFQAEATITSPLTLDHAALGALVESVRNGRLPEGTAIGSGIATSTNALRESTARSRVVILLTDGENNAGDIEPGAAARVAKALGVRVYTIGLANAADAGSRRLVGIDERVMQEIANIAGGRYFPAVGLESLKEVYDTIGELETSRVGAREFTTFNEYAPYFLVAGLAFLVLEQVAAATLARRAP